MLRVLQDPGGTHYISVIFKGVLFVEACMKLGPYVPSLKISEWDSYIPVWKGVSVCLERA